MIPLNDEQFRLLTKCLKHNAMIDPVKIEIEIPAIVLFILEQLADSVGITKEVKAYEFIKKTMDIKISRAVLNLMQKRSSDNGNG